MPLRMMRSCHAALFAVLALPGALAAQQGGADPARLQRDVAVLADDRWEGRATGTPGNDSAAHYIAARFAALGLRPAGDPSSSGTAAFFHRFTARPTSFSHTNEPVELRSQNVAALLPGTDPVLREEVVIIGAHFDHLGRGQWRGALDADAADAIRNGADDNASGTAGVLELARLFAGAPTKRSLLFVAFSGEEMGLLGSARFADEALPPGRRQAMLNFDMIGRLREDKVIVYGTGTASELPALLEAANAGPRPLVIRPVPDGFGPSDHTSFYAKGMPVLHFFTDLHEDYHKATDDADKVDAAGTARVIDLAARVLRTLGDQPAPLTFLQQAPPVRTGPATPGARPYLGSIPDMAGGDVPGLRVTGITPGSPADAGGMKAGDIVVELDGKAVTDLDTYTAALYARQPGDTIVIVVRRGSERVTLRVTLRARS
jgi:hypothetical protein